MGVPALCAAPLPPSDKGATPNPIKLKSALASSEAHAASSSTAGIKSAALLKAQARQQARKTKARIALRLDSRDFFREYRMEKIEHIRDSWGVWRCVSHQKEARRRIALCTQRSADPSEKDEHQLWAHVTKLKDGEILTDAYCSHTEMMLVYSVDPLEFHPVLEANVPITEDGAATWARRTFADVNRLHNDGVFIGSTSLDHLRGTSLESAQLLGIGLVGFLVPAPWARDSAQLTEACCLTFVAPELLEFGDLANATDLSDAWTLGMLLYCLLTGGPPFDARNLGATATRKAVLQFEPSFEGEVWEAVSESCVLLLRGLLARDPNRRTSIACALRDSTWLAASSSRKTHQLNGVSEFKQKWKSWKSGGALWRAGRHLAAGGMPRAAVLELERTFREFDVDGSGGLTAQEVRQGLLQHKTKLPKDINELLIGIDADSSGDIDITEWIAALLEERDFHQEEALLVAFRHYDTDGSGKINRAELQSALQSTAGWHELERADVDKILKSADVDGDGQLSYEEFVNMLRKEQADSTVVPRTRSRSRVPRQASAAAPAIACMCCTTAALAHQDGGTSPKVITPLEGMSRNGSPCQHVN